MAKFSDLIAGQIPTLIDFSAEWCGPCQMLKPELEKLASMVEEKVRIIKIDVDRNTHLAGQLGVQGVPTLMLYQNGKLLWRSSGYQTAQQLKVTLSQLVSI
ncbi:MAG TPA: thiol reductase thioredoxin [Microscillaceae bacterium]|nr:thiol reductase thioredoxin [Microscillaceae bacterium]